MATGRAARRFFELAEVPRVFPAIGGSLRVLLLADDRHPANVVQDHIRAFLEHSAHRYTVVNTRHVTLPDDIDEGVWDAIVVHYSIFAISDVYLSRRWCAFIARFHGPVAVIHEDEYQRIFEFRRRFAELGVEALFSCLDSVDNLKRVYGGSPLLAKTLFFSCLPGYVPPALLDIQPAPIRGRRLDVIYRGRTLPPQLGRLGQEKRLIGEQMQALARGHGLNCDISSAEEDRIYGPQWQQFLMSGKAMLGVEGGASMFDFDGQLQASVEEYRTAHPEASFEEIWASILASHEGNVDFRTITPKFFEAIAAGTVLLLYPGRYSGVLEAGRHYITLQRDGSNAAEVVERLRDDQFLQEMADRTRAEILGRQDLGSPFYVKQIDRVLAEIVANPTRERCLRASLQLTTLDDLASLRDGPSGQPSPLKAAMDQAQVAVEQACADARAAADQARASVEQVRAEAEIRAERDEQLRIALEAKLADLHALAATARIEAEELKARVHGLEARMASGRELLKLLLRRIGSRAARLAGIRR